MRSWKPAVLSLTLILPRQQGGERLRKTWQASCKIPVT
ncbi:hypothetical protein [Klebsiella aerogenes EA1509E]|nr:hypothetical protein CSC18_2154 [Klebsiella aerogenes]CCG29323.1 hypothetical protein [Klebsiella aerogenes EA1509E]